ncbi:hypothetical protein QE152_g4322 [Popillia japonica]|uniref:Uncharacterized protein n=1 Tax=Popillia japonica TaxID=7064 RepID=A0AAW1N2W6_POPJA
MKTVENKEFSSEFDESDYTLHDSSKEINDPKDNDDLSLINMQNKQPSPQLSCFERSRKKKPEVSIRNRLKRQRYSDTDPNLRRFQRPCNHNTNSLKCSLVKISDIKNARKKFYEESAKSVQDQKLCHLIRVN